MHRRECLKTRQFGLMNGVAMATADGMEQAERRAGTALVPLMPTLRWVHKAPMPRPDPSFVAQLIANAEHLPQTSRLLSLIHI